jgi:hypothetical protein
MGPGKLKCSYECWSEHSNVGDSFGSEGFPSPYSKTVFFEDLEYLGCTANSVNFPQQRRKQGLGCFGSASSELNSQQHTIQSPSDAVLDRFGQITLPLDVTSGVRTARDSGAEAARAQTAEQARLARSEPARNAANQWHAKSRTVGRINRRKNAALSDGEEGDPAGKQATYREKNRLAAARCRARKKENAAGLEEKYRKLSAMNLVLKKQINELRDDFVDLRAQALDHQDCNCQINHYNIRQVRIVALSVSAQSSPLQYGGAPTTTTMTTMAKGEAGDIPLLDDFMFSKPCNHRINSYQPSP